MIPILSVAQIREADAFTIAHEPILSIDLMERAAIAFTDRFLSLFEPTNPIVVVCGVGNNGGDGLAIARLLTSCQFSVSVIVCGSWEKATTDFQVNYNRLSDLISIHWFVSETELSILEANKVIIDGLFGSGLSRPIVGHEAQLVSWMNHQQATVVAIDIPSGLFADAAVLPQSPVVRAHHTITFQLPKLIMLQPISAPFVGEVHVVNIGLHQAYLNGAKTAYFISESADIQLPTRNKYAHKGDAGRVLIVAGSRGKMGAATLCANAAVRAGAGLVFVQAPACGLNILQVAVPEAMVIVDEHDEVITEILPAENIYAIAIGPGIGSGVLTAKALEQLLIQWDKPIVLDADALNILAENRHLLNHLRKDCILTPHPGEFRRLVGEWTDDFHKLHLLQEYAQKYQVNILLKGANSAVCNSAGVVFFNPTGNPGMATGGSGDVLTGIVVAFLAQGLAPFEALKSAVYMHGLAGDLAKSQVGEISLRASDMLTYLPKALIQMG